MSMIPVEGGQYRFAYKINSSESYIGVFHSYSVADSTFDVDLYIDAFTPANAVPSKFISLLGLPNLKRHEESTRVGIKVADIVILDRLYICKNSVFQERRVQWRLGMRNLYRISDDEADEHLSFIGDDGYIGSYINEENEYLVFTILLVKVQKLTLLFVVHFVYFLISESTFYSSILTKRYAPRNALSTQSLSWILSLDISSRDF